MNRNRIYRSFLPGAAALILVATLISACSVTKRIPDGQVLYTGIKNLEIVSPEDEKIPDELRSQLVEAVNAKTNSPIPFLTPYRLSPFAFRLWLYNSATDSTKGLKGWLYRHFAKPPVLIKDVRAKDRVDMIESILDNNGYFQGTASYSTVIDKKNDKKGKLSYDIHTGPAYMIDSVIYLKNDSSLLCRSIDSVARVSPYLKAGMQYCVDSLAAERIRIVNRLRNRGFYFMKPEFIIFLADSTLAKDKIAIKLSLADDIPGPFLKRYKVGKISTLIERQSQRNPGTPDTLQTSKGELVVMQPARLKTDIIPENITFRPGRWFSVRDMDRTQTRLARLGIFSNIQIMPQLVDTTSNLLDVNILCRFDRPMEASLEVNATSKSNSYIGPGLTFGISQHNLFGGGEKLNVTFTASYEWQTGRNASSVFNSYEFGVNASLAFPRLLAPKFIKRIKRELNWTTFSAGASILNRPHYFKMWQANLGMTYEWRYSRHVLNNFTPFKLTYTNLLKTTEVFDSIMAENPSIRQSFESQFIPQMNYTYTYDKFFERERINGINFQASVTEAGNIFWGLYSLFGQKGEKKLFRTPFSQFVKGQVQLVYNRRLIRGTEHWWVSRILVGAEHAYGNSSEVPYADQFYIGGANSIRAFTVRSLGPGSYRSPRDATDGYFDQTGTFKFEFNTEYRFPLAGQLHGAVFIDTGNVWLLRNDPSRPGGKLTAKDFFKDLALGTGVGLRFDMGMLVIRGDLGYGLHAPYATSVPGYFNIRFKDAFAFHLAIGYPF